MMAYAWIYYDRRYFISTAYLLSDGRPYSCVIWRQQEQDYEQKFQVNNEGGVHEELLVAHPKSLEIYYDKCAAIYQQNRHRQDTLCIERKIEAKISDKRVITSLFGMYVVGTWLIYTGSKTDTFHFEPEQDKKEFYCILEE